MRHDPILHKIGVGVHRAILFAMGAALIAVMLWLAVMTQCLDIPFKDLQKWAAAAWPPVTSKAAAALLWQPVAIGVLTMAVIYLLIGKWWKNHADVQRHHRGARLDDWEA